jgi:hypothetical protein
MRARASIVHSFFFFNKKNKINNDNHNTHNPINNNPTTNLRWENRRHEPLWLSCLFSPPGAALRYALALWMARHEVRVGGVLCIYVCMWVVGVRWAGVCASVRVCIYMCVVCIRVCCMYMCVVAILSLLPPSRWLGMRYVYDVIRV